MRLSSGVGTWFPICQFFSCIILTLIGVPPSGHLVDAQQLIEVDSWADDFDLGSRNESMLVLAEEYCGPDTSADPGCTLRAAFFYASSLVGSEVEIWVNIEQQELSMEQSTAIQVSGPSSLTLDGNGHRVLGGDGDTFFNITGEIAVTFINIGFDKFHATEDGDETINGVVITVDDPAASLEVTNCTFENSYTNEVGEPRGLGGVIYATGSLSIKNSTFSYNIFNSGDYQPSTWNSSLSTFDNDWETPSPQEASFTASPTQNPSPAGDSSAIYGYSTPSPSAASFATPVTSAPSPDSGSSNDTGAFPTPGPTESPLTAGPFSTASPAAAGNFTAGNVSTPSPSGMGNFSTPSPIVAGNFTLGNVSTPSPSGMGNFSTPSPIVAGNFTPGNVSTPSPSGMGNFSTPSPIVADNFTSGNVSTPSPSGMGNFSTLSPIVAGNFTSGNVSTPSPSGMGNFSTPAPIVAGNFTPGNVSTPSPSGMGNFSTPAPIVAGNFTSGNVSTPSPSGVGNFSTPSPIAAANFTAGNSTSGNFTSANVSAAGDQTIGVGVPTTGIAGQSKVVVPTPAPTSIPTTNPEGHSGESHPNSLDSYGWKGWSQETYPYDNDWRGSYISAGSARGRRLQAQENSSVSSYSDQEDFSGNASYPDDPWSSSNWTGGDFGSSMSATDSSFNTVRNGAAVNWNNSALDSAKTLNITGCTFLGNSVNLGDEELVGGAIVARGGMVTVSATLFQENNADFGAALCVQYGNLTVAGSEFVGNTANQFGGGVMLISAGFMFVRNSVFEYNSAGNGGGAIAVGTESSEHRYDIDGCEFRYNSAGFVGGAALLMVEQSRNETEDGGILTFTSPAFLGNSAAVDGSIMSVWCGNVVVESDFSSEYQDGGGFAIQDGFENCSALTFGPLQELESGPALSSARFSDTGTSIVVTFDQNTDYGAVAELGGSFKCPLLFSYDGASDLDACTWTTAASVTATLNYNASVVPSDSITALARKVALPTSATAVNAASSVAISAPENPAEPILVPEVWYTALAHCEDLVLDVSASTGAGGRLMESYGWELYDWTVEKESDAPSAELEGVAAASALGGSSKLTLPGADRASENTLTWLFNITAINWLGGIGWKSIEVRVSSAIEYPPLLSLAGGSTRTALRAASLSIKAEAKVPTCVINKTTPLTYQWSELRTGGTFMSTSADSSMFKLSSHSLEVGTTYEFRVDVTDSVGSSSYATQVVTVESSSLIAAVAGGNSTVSRGADLVLDIIAVDPDEEDQACQDCIYNVSCTGTLSGSACDLSLPFGETSNSELTLASNELETGETYTLEIGARRASESTWSTTSTFFTIGTEMLIPSLAVTPLSVEKVNADAVVAIEAKMTLVEEFAGGAEWTMTEGVLNGFDELSLAASSSVIYTASGGGLISTNLVLSANSLLAGSSYTFSLTATYVSDGRRRLQEDGATDAAVMSISFSVNTPPTGGSFEVSPAAGVALMDVFELNTYGWEDDVDDLPLTYTFAYVSGSADAAEISSEMIVRAALESSEATDVYLPQGFGSNSTLFASVYATDTLGASSRATFGVAVSAYEGGVEDLSALVDDVATEALAAGDTDTVMQVLDVASSSLNAANCTAAPDCEAFNRYDCGANDLREDNTCGECLKGTVGIMGPDNSQCIDPESLDVSCSDGIKNGDETDVDCGGSTCNPCTSGSTCLVDADCSYNNCPEPELAAVEKICIPPAKRCPNDCGGATRGICQYASSTSGAALNATECLADTPTSTCRASCGCFDGYGGDGCQYSDAELEVAVEMREQSLIFIQDSAASLDVSRDTISRQAALLSKLSVVPAELKTSSLDLVLNLTVLTANVADESGEGVADTTSSAMVEIIGQVTLASSHLGAESDVGGLSDVLRSLIAAQVSGKVVGENAEEVSSDYFRLSTGVYDSAALGEVQISPPLTAADKVVGRSAPSVGLPSEIGGSLSGVSSMSLAVAEWIIDPRQTSTTGTNSSNDSNEVVSSVVRFYADPSDEAASSSRRRLASLQSPKAQSDELASGEERVGIGRRRRRSLLEDLGFLQITIPNTVSQAWDPQDIESFIHECGWDSTETQTSTCPNGTEITTACTGIASTREVVCSNSGTEPECASWQGSESSSGSASSAACEVSSFNESWTTCICSYTATVGDISDGTGSNQVDFASTLLDTPGEFISIWSEVTTLTWSEVQAAAPIFITMAGILILASLSAGFGWRFDQKDRGRAAGFRAWLSSTICFCLSRGSCWRPEAPKIGGSPMQSDVHHREVLPVNNAPAPTPRSAKGKMTHDDNLKALVASVAGVEQKATKSIAPHHLGERRVKKSLKLLVMIHHDFVSVWFCFYEWFTRPLRVALLLCTVVTLMATEATVFSTIMFKDDGLCGTFENLVDCAGSETANVSVGDVGSSCAWDEDSRTCFLPEPEEDMETSLVISTISLILALPFEVLIVVIFATFLVKPAKGIKGAGEGAESTEQDSAILSSTPSRGAPRLAATSLKTYDTDGARGCFETRLAQELAHARAAEHKRNGKMKGMCKVLCCVCGFSEGEERREARLEKTVKRCIGPAMELEDRMAKAGEPQAQEVLLFERAEGDSLSFLERQVFLKSRILNYGEEDDVSAVSWCTKGLAWLFIVVYAVGLSFYVCLFAVKAGRATSIQWMISFWVAFAEDILLLIPLKLAFVYLFLPSLMRHRMRPDMFTRIPRHAASVQVARRNPHLQVSGLILRGNIPAGSEFEKFIPLFSTTSRWYACLTGTVFTTLAIIMLLPDTFQAMVLDVLIAVMVGGGIFGLAKLFPISFWAFVGILMLSSLIMVVLWTNHKRTMKKEKKLRKAHQVGYARGTADSGGGTRNDLPSAEWHHLNTPSPGNTILSGAPGGGRGQQSPSINTESLARWVSSKKPSTTLQALESPKNLIQGGRPSSMASDGMISEAGSGWAHHGRLDSCAASAWGGVHISDVDSSAHDNDEDGDLNLTRAQPQLDERSGSFETSASRDEWNRPGKTFDSVHSIDNLDLSDDLGTTASSTFFNDLEGPSHRPYDSIMMALSNHRDGEDDDDDDDSAYQRSPGIMTQTGSVWPTSRSQDLHTSTWQPDMTTCGDDEDSSRWDGSPASSQAGGVQADRNAASSRRCNESLASGAARSRRSRSPNSNTGQI